jgi:hypothetical protein
MSSFIRPVSVLLAVLIVSACVEERVGRRSSIDQNLKAYDDQNVYQFSPLDSRYNVDPPFSGDLPPLPEKEETSEFYDPFAKYSAQTYHGSDFTITRHYYLPTGRGLNIAKLLVGHVPDLSFYGPSEGTYQDINKVFDGQAPDAKNPNKAVGLGVNQVLVFTNVIQDARPTAQVPSMPGFDAYHHKTGMVSDLMIVKSSDEQKLMEVDSFLTSLLTELPQIEIKVKVVEISVNDELQWGNENLITKETSSNKYFLKEWFNFYNTESMIKSGGNAADFQGSLFNALGVHDSYRLDATFELLQRITDSDILSAPTMTVLVGHRAIIETGDKVPLQEVVANVSQAWYNYKYQQTGVKLIIVPYLLPDNVVELHLNVEVVEVSGKETFDTPIGTLSQPILANRQASTRVKIPEGHAFALGGLMATAEFDVVKKLPLLGDIPVLGLLFKSRSIEKEQSQIIFYIEPRVVKRAHGWQKRKKE